MQLKQSELYTYSKTTYTVFSTKFVPDIVTDGSANHGSLPH
jgi:hypothetical protein